MFLGMSCKKRAKVVQDNIPYQTVNMTIYPNDPLYFKLQAVGGWVYVKGGVNGIIAVSYTHLDVYKRQTKGGAAKVDVIGAV